MKDRFYTRDSMFIEFNDVVNYLKGKDLETEEKLPAMIILEKQVDGINKHGIIGRPYEVCPLFEWGISQYASLNDISFEKLMLLIQKMHDEMTEKIIFHSEKGDINEDYGKDFGE